MRVYRTLAEVRAEPRRRRGLSLGVFDGVHQGHAKILGTLKRSVSDEGLDAALALTFHPHPLALLRPDRAPKMIMTPDERLGELERQGIDEALLLEFTPELAVTPYSRFTRETLLADLGLKVLVAGYDFHLGKDREGSAEDMAALGETLGFRVKVVTPFYLDGSIISSTRIRADLMAGRVEEVARALGHPYVISGEVIPGQGKGREMSVPTANLTPPSPEKALPPAGVYLVRTELDGADVSGVMNLGWAPTLRGSFLPEVHLLDYEGDLYGRHLELYVLKQLRPERRFPDPQALLVQIQADLARARRILAAELLEDD